MKNLKDMELLTLIKSKVQTERNLTLEIIEILQEIRDRRLHLQRGYSSLHEFCVKELKYSDGAAYRRIKAMKLVEDIPEALKSIESGSLSLTTASQLQNVFESKEKTAKPLSLDEKTELFERVQNQSRQEVERTIARLCPEIVKTPEKVRPMNDTQVKVELVLDIELYAKLEKIKHLTSHKNKSLIELIGYLADRELKRCDPELKTVKKVTTASPGEAVTRSVASSQRNKLSRYIPSAVRHSVWMKSKGRCTFVDPLTKRKCESNYKLQFEHIKPFAVGGENTVENLRILCSSHNVLNAIRFYGKAKIERHQRN
ncbi:MAG: HNH endonuclease [Bdellovibrionales bacterium]